MNLGSERRAFLGTNQQDFTKPGNARRSGSWSLGSAFRREVLLTSAFKITNYGIKSPS